MKTKTNAYSAVIMIESSPSSRKNVEAAADSQTKPADLGYKAAIVRSPSPFTEHIIKPDS